MEHTPRNNFKKITGLRLECHGSEDWHFTTAYTRWLEDRYKELIEALIEIQKAQYQPAGPLSGLNTVIKLSRAIIEKQTGKTWEELNE